MRNGKSRALATIAGLVKEPRVRVGGQEAKELKGKAGGQEVKEPRVRVGGQEVKELKAKAGGLVKVGVRSLKAKTNCALN